MIKKKKEKTIPITKRMVWEAYKNVKRKKGSAGIDGVNFIEFEENLSKNLYKIWNRLSSGSYFPPYVKEVAIPKKSGGVRLLGIPTIADRVAQTVLKEYLEPRFEAIFWPSSFGYRPKKSAHDALTQVRGNCREYSWVIDLDIKGFFDNLDHDLLLKAVDLHVEEKWVKMYIKRWLETAVVKADGEILEKQGKGTPQGGVISPLLANLFLHYAFDVWMGKSYPHLRFARYADDVIVHCITQKEAEQVLDSIHKRMESCKLELHPKKTKIVYCKDFRRKAKYPNVKFDFLGFSFQPRTCLSKERQRPFLGFDPAISRSSGKEIVATLRKLQLKRWSKATIEEIADILNPKIRGWINYFGKFRKFELKKVFRKLEEYLMRWALNKFKSLKYSIWRGYKLINKFYKLKPRLFYHWEAGFKP
ncbi:MAG: group II intron reverse transcriptase/maturase [Crocinitomix sp.]|nr:group II intron reverse transcriptase/maturase [Crocinitomix sp.]